MFKFQTRTTFHVDVTDRQAQIFLFMLNKIAERMNENWFGVDIFRRITSIDVYSYNNRSPELVANNAVGLAFFDGRIHTTFYDGPGDNYVMAMEMAHNAIQTLIQDKFYNPYDKMNNWIHFAANQPTPTVGEFAKPGETYLPSQQYTFRTMKEFFLGKPRQPLPLMWYDLGLIMRDCTTMNKMLENGTAPPGPNPYWTATDIESMTAKGIIPGALEEADEHENYLAMGHW